MMIEEGELSANAQRAAKLIRDEVGVRWPAGHLEIALIQVQRRRQQRRAAVRASLLGAGGLSLLVALGGGSHVRELVAQVLPDWAAPALAGFDSTPAAPAPVVAPRVVPIVAPIARASTEAASPESASTVAAASAPARAADVAPAREGHLLQQRLVPRRQVAAARWVALAGEKRFGEAYGLLRQVPMRDLSDPDDLLLAADVARQAGRSDRAVPFLQRVVKEHPHELCAQLAGFSLGKVYLDGMDEPVLAARSFASVRAMAPTGGLAQDALAREVEAWARAGMSSRAHDAAVEYLRLYPNGRRAAAVRDLGRI